MVGSVCRRRKFLLQTDLIATVDDKKESEKQTSSKEDEFIKTSGAFSTIKTVLKNLKYSQNGESDEVSL